MSPALPGLPSYVPRGLLRPPGGIRGRGLVYSHLHIHAGAVSRAGEASVVFLLYPKQNFKKN